ncbi:MAG: hypothetical protein ACJ779_01555, partial [Chloroflexota bacterium]
AQTAAIIGDVPARHWVHGEFLLMDGRKMAKSAGNFLRVTELAERGIDRLAFRYLTLTSRHSRKLEFSDRSVDAAAAALASLRAGVLALGPAPADGPWAAPPPLRAGRAGDRPTGVATGIAGHGSDGSVSYALADHATAPVAPLSDAGRSLHERFVRAIDDDLDMPAALALLREILRAPIPDEERRWLILDADAVLGLDLESVWTTGDAPDEASVPAEAAALRTERDAARAARDYARADALRDQLAAAGWDVMDGPDGSRLTRRGHDTSD